MVGDEATAPDLGQAALWGMAQAVIAERPALRCRLIDLDPDRSYEAQQAVLDAEQYAEDEAAVAWRGGRRLARRLEAPPRLLPAAEAATLPYPGVLRWEPRAATAPGPGMVRIGVVAAGLTFRDRLLFNGLVPGTMPLGSDCAGVVEAVGAGVSDLRPGDHVVALAANGAIADTVIVPAIAVAPAPCAGSRGGGHHGGPLPDRARRSAAALDRTTAFSSIRPAAQRGWRRWLAGAACRGTGDCHRRAAPLHAWFGPEQIVLDSRDPARNGVMRWPASPSPLAHSIRRRWIGSRACRWSIWTSGPPGISTSIASIPALKRICWTGCASCRRCRGAWCRAPSWRQRCPARGRWSAAPSCCCGNRRHGADRAQVPPISSPARLVRLPVAWSPTGLRHRRCRAVPGGPRADAGRSAASRGPGRLRRCGGDDRVVRPPGRTSRRRCVACSIVPPSSTMTVWRDRRPSGWRRCCGQRWTARGCWIG